MKKLVLGVFMGLLAACGGGSSAPIDTVIVTIDAAGGADAAPTACNVNLQTGCPTGDKCTWIRVQTGTSPLGVIGCAALPTTPVATGGTCTWGASGMTTGFDNCAVDNYCSSDASTEAAMGICTPICSLTGNDLPCPTGFSCSRFSDTFGNAGDTPVTGLCNSNCDPLTQDDATGVAACGGGLDSSNNPKKQCVGFPAQTPGTQTQFSCADVLQPPNGAVTNLNGHVLVKTGTGATATGEVYINSCGPRALPLLDPSTTDTTDSMCVALCGPGDSSMGSVTDIRGVAPNNLDRTDVSLGNIGASDECRFWWFLENDGTGNQASTSSFSNGLGFDWGIANYTFDGSSLTPPQSTTQPVPSCATLTLTVPGTFDTTISDAEFWGCVHQTTPVPLNSPTLRIKKDPRVDLIRQIRAGLPNAAK